MISWLFDDTWMSDNIHRYLSVFHYLLRPIMIELKKMIERIPKLHIQILYNAVLMCSYCKLEYLWWLEVNKCAFTFSSEIRQIQCTRTEFWCVQCPRPAGPSALDKHQIQASALDLSYFTSKSKCKFINLIHTRQKNKIIYSCLWKIINKMVLKSH